MQLTLPTGTRPPFRRHDGGPTSTTLGTARPTCAADRRRAVLGLAVAAALALTACSSSVPDGPVQSVSFSTLPPNTSTTPASPSNAALAAAGPATTYVIHYAAQDGTRVSLTFALHHAELPPSIAQHIRGAAYRAWSGSREEAEQEHSEDLFDRVYLGHYASVDHYVETLVDAYDLDARLDVAIAEPFRRFVDIDIPELARAFVANGSLFTLPATPLGVWVFNGDIG